MPTMQILDFVSRLAGVAIQATGRCGRMSSLIRRWTANALSGAAIHDVLSNDIRHFCEFPFRFLSSEV